MKYTALTIGPIFDTISLASKPGALWTASYMFSYLTKCLCLQLVDCGLPEKNIITPYFTVQTDDPGYYMLNKKDGVGLFHDRIIYFHDDDFVLIKDGKTCTLAEIKAAALEDVYTAFSFDDTAKKYLDEYILIADTTFDAVDESGNSVNPIFTAGIILDSLELSKTYAYRSVSNPLLSVFEGSTEHQNEEVKKLPAVDVLESWQLWRNSTKKQLKSLGDIATGGKYDINSEKSQNKPKYKKHYYYAIVRSDGDNMSSVIKGLVDDKDIRAFSRKCLSYCSDIAKIVYESFGGVTIFSGGDDLLAILPCETENGNTIFNYIQAANKKFKEYFPAEKSSLSFGITICHYKYPLYEALEESAHLLFDIAKADKYGKNCAAVNLHKHSGQTSGIVIKNSHSLERFLELQNTICANSSNADRDEKEPLLLSVLYKLSMLEDLFVAAKSDETGIKNLFRNCFDAPAHEIDFITKVIPEFYIGLMKNDIDIVPFVSDDELFTNKNTDQNDLFKDVFVRKNDRAPTSIKSICSVLRILKFLVESAGDN